MDRYLATRAEVLALGVDALVVVDVVLPAVLGPAESRLDRMVWSMISERHRVLVHVREASIVTCPRERLLVLAQQSKAPYDGGVRGQSIITIFRTYQLWPS